MSNETKIAEALAWLASRENRDEETREQARGVLDALLFHQLSQPDGGARERKPPRQQTGAGAQP